MFVDYYSLMFFVKRHQFNENNRAIFGFWLHAVALYAYVVDVMPKNGIIGADGEDINLLPRHDEAVVPIEKFT